MPISGAFTTVANAAKAAKIVFEASKTLANAELKQSIADLAMMLADASLEMAELKHEMIRLQEENANLKGKKEKPTPKMKSGCYQFEGIEGLYCPKCYENDGKMHQTARAMSGRYYRCSVCGEMHPAR